jgi:PhnB protein
MPKKVRPVPKGYHTVTPSLTQDSAAQTIDFCRRAFGAKLRMKLADPAGRIMHAEIEIGDSVVMFTDAMRDPAQPASLFLYVENVDKAFARAVKAGATAVMQPTDMFWGDRFGTVQDPFGNKWAMATHVEDVTPAEMRKRQKAAVAEFTGAGG